jgi:Icc-related predicted phosphoesterase
MKLLAFSDLHRDLTHARHLADLSAEVDAVIGAGDFASVHRGLEDTIEALSAIQAPALLVPGNNETEEALRAACADWPAATVLHGQGHEVDGVAFYGLGAGVPVTPWDWSFDLEEQVAEELLDGCPEGAVLISHSPPRGHCDQSSGGKSLGSEAVLAAIEDRRPRLVLCGHIHEAWGCESEVGPSPVVNLGPVGRILDVPSPS